MWKWILPMVIIFVLFILVFSICLVYEILYLKQKKFFIKKFNDDKIKKDIKKDIKKNLKNELGNKNKKSIN